MRLSGREIDTVLLIFCISLMRLKLCNILYIKDAYTDESQLNKEPYVFIRNQSSLLGIRLSDIEVYAPSL
jgi:hypothetical protein